MKKILISFIFITIVSIVFFFTRSNNNFKKTKAKYSIKLEEFDNSKDPMVLKNKLNKKISSYEKEIHNKKSDNYTILEKEVYVIHKPEFRLGRITYNTSNEGLYRILKKGNKERLITNKIFFNKRDLDVLRKIFPNNKIEIKPNYISMEIKFKKIKETYSALKKENIKFNHEYLRPSPIPL